MSDSENEENEAFVEYEWTGRDCQAAIDAAFQMGHRVENIGFTDGDLWVNDKEGPCLLVIASREHGIWSFEAYPQNQLYADKDLEGFSAAGATVRSAVHAVADFVVIAREKGGLKSHNMRIVERCALSMRSR